MNNKLNAYAINLLLLVSRGSADMEIVVWNLRKSTPNDIEIHKSLSWPDAQECTGLRYKVIELNSMLIEKDIGVYTHFHHLTR